MSEDINRLRREVAWALIEMRALVLASTLLSLGPTGDETTIDKLADDFRDADQRLRDSIDALGREAGPE